MDTWISSQIATILKDFGAFETILAEKCHNIILVKQLYVFLMNYK